MDPLKTNHPTTQTVACELASATSALDCAIREQDWDTAKHAMDHVNEALSQLSRLPPAVREDPNKAVIDMLDLFPNKLQLVNEEALKRFEEETQALHARWTDGTYHNTEATRAAVKQEMAGIVSDAIARGDLVKA